MDWKSVDKYLNALLLVFIAIITQAAIIRQDWYIVAIQGLFAIFAIGNLIRHKTE